MKRIFSLLLTLCLLPCAALGEADAYPVEAQNAMVTVRRVHEETEDDTRAVVSDYPLFESAEADLVDYLNQTVTQGLLKLRQTDAPMAEADAYAQGEKDRVECGFFASLELEDLLSVWGSVVNTPAGGEGQTSVFRCVVLLSERRELTVYDLFTEDASTVDAAIAEASGQEGQPSAFFLKKDCLRVIIGGKTVDVPWETLALMPTAPLSGQVTTKPQGDSAASEPSASPEDTLQPEPSATPEIAPTDEIATPAPESAAPAPTPDYTREPEYTLQPVTESDLSAVDTLSQGLWKPVGGDGTLYFQFTEDGKLLVVQVLSYNLQNDQISSPALAGELTLGGTAFTLTKPDGTQQAYVLNREAMPVSLEELVTPTPTPRPTDTPAPTATPAPTPSPTPTASPTPSLSPTPVVMGVKASAIELKAMEGTVFERRKSLKVYSAPSKDAYRESSAQVTTDDTVRVYGAEGEWLLVEYDMNSGKRSRFGYISNGTVADGVTVPTLQWMNVDAVMAKNAAATDDPLNAKTERCKLKEGTPVKLLATLGDWAYIETEYKSKPCRWFVAFGSLRFE